MTAGGSWGERKEDGRRGRVGTAEGWDSQGNLSGFWVGIRRLSEAPLLPGSVFQLTHNVYKPFIFAADTLADLSM